MKVVINNRNRLTTTRNMVELLLRLNPSEEIIILDNGSTYPPLLEWYDQIKDTVEVRMLKNEGHLAIWAIDLDKTIGEFFVYTDSDIELNQDFPMDWKEIMLNLFNKYPSYNKIALALKIDDLPDHYIFKQQVIGNETRWWANKVDEHLYAADTDTTFFMQRNIFDNCYPSLRIARPDMIAKHAPWYHDISNLSEEEKYYLDNLGERALTQYSKQHKSPYLYK